MAVECVGWYTGDDGMTWNEFKAQVEKLMGEKNISKDEEIFFIDITLQDEISVGVNPDLGITIS